MAHAHKEGNNLVLTTLNQPYVLTQKQLMIIFFLLIFITCSVILFSIFNTIYLGEIGNRLLQEILKLRGGIVPTLTP